MRRDGIGGPTRLGLIVIGVVFFLILIGLFTFITGGPGASPAGQADAASVTSPSSTRSVRMTVYGPIVADEDRQSYQITISPSQRVVTAYKGYGGSQVATASYDNSSEAYQELVYALSRVDFDVRRQLNDEQADDRGVCATGKRYVFEILENGSTLTRSWTTSCSSAKGTFGGATTSVTELFNKQIPSLSTVIKPVNLR